MSKSKKRRDRLRAAGLCIECGRNEIYTPKSVCRCWGCLFNHRGENLERAKALYESRLNKSVCVMCGDAGLVSKTKCKTCHEKTKLGLSQRRQGFLDRGLCGACGAHALVKGKRHCEICLSKAKRARKKKNEKGLCHDCGTQCNASRCDECKTKHSGRAQELKMRVYEGYGCACNCCGEKNPAFLTIDHVKNDGAKRRKEGEGNGSKLYNKILRENFPCDFQLLCWNCNMGKRFSGVCPHNK